MSGFKRLHRASRAVFKGATLAALTPRGAWLLKRSEERYMKRGDAYGLSAPITGEIGRIESVRFISSDVYFCNPVQPYAWPAKPGNRAPISADRSRNDMNEARNPSLHALECGTKYPYDGRPTIDAANTAALGILHDLCDRGGIKHVLNVVEDSVREEIVDSLAAIVRTAIKPIDAVPVDGAISFGRALQRLKMGGCVRRTSWAADTWITLGAAHPGLEAGKFWNAHARALAEANGGTAPVHQHFIQAAAGQVQMGWTPTQADMLAEDWHVV